MKKFYLSAKINGKRRQLHGVSYFFPEFIKLFQVEKIYKKICYIYAIRKC